MCRRSARARGVRGGHPAGGDLRARGARARRRTAGDCRTRRRARVLRRPLHRVSARRRRRGPTGPAGTHGAGTAQPAERAGGGGRGRRARHRLPGCGGHAARLSRRRAAVRASGRSQRRARGGRLRPSPDRDCRGARGGQGHARPPSRGGVSAPPLHAHRAADARLRSGVRRRRRGGADRHLRGERGADSRRHRRSAGRERGPCHRTPGACGQGHRRASPPSSRPRRVRATRC